MHEQPNVAAPEAGPKQITNPDVRHSDEAFFERIEKRYDSYLARVAADVAGEQPVIETVTPVVAEAPEATTYSLDEARDKKEAKEARNHAFSLKRLGALAAASFVALGAYSFASYSRERPADPTAASAEGNGTTRSTEINGSLAVEYKPGLIGEAPCGPKVNVEEARKRFEAGDTVIKPTETAAFFDAHPEVEKAKTDFYDTNYGSKFIDWIKANKKILNPDLLKPNAQNSNVRELMARMDSRELKGVSIAVQNHQCVNDKIVKVENITALGDGEQVWALNFTQPELDAMKAAGIKMPERGVTASASDHGIAMALLAERLACNNPLLTREQIHKVIKRQATPTTMRHLVVPGPSTSTTLLPPPTTETTLAPTTTSSTPTTAPSTTTSRPGSTTSTTIPVTTTVPSTTTTVPLQPKPPGTNPPTEETTIVTIDPLHGHEPTTVKLPEPTTLVTSPANTIVVTTIETGRTSTTVNND